MKKTLSKTSAIIDHLTPECGVTGVLMLLGCCADCYFTYHFEWDAWLFGAVFTGIMVPGKGIKVLDNYVIGKKK